MPKTDSDNETPRPEIALPQKPWKRHADGPKMGLIENFDYPFSLTGGIDWEKLISPKYLIYPNNDYGREPMVKVDGLRDLAEIRGVSAKEVEIIPVSDRLIVCKCKILFIPNVYEPKGRMWEGAADASPENINGKLFGRFLTACADTRATGRCIKEALGIRVLVQEEVTDQDEGESNAPIAGEVIAAIERQAQLKGKADTLLKDIMEKYKDIKSMSDLTKGQGAKLLQWLNAMPNAKQE